MVENRKPWWETYFDERFVELYRPFLPEEDTRAEVEGIVEMLELPRSSRILDLGCGWGRHSVELARLGFRVTGLDLSEPLLGHARAAAEQAGVAVEWVRADMREIPPGEPFDGVLSLFSSMGYFGSKREELRVLRGVRGALRPGGRFLLETMHRDQVVREYAERDWWTGEDGAHVWVQRRLDAVRGVSREWLRWRDGEMTGEKYHEIRIRSATEWGALLVRAGLRPVAWWGGWEMEPFSHTSERLVVMATAG